MGDTQPDDVRIDCGKGKGTWAPDSFLALDRYEMNLRVILLPLKILVLVSMVFLNSVGLVLMAAGVLLILVIIPKVNTMVGLVLYSGYMKSSAGIIYIVDEKEREEARAQGFKGLSLFSSAVHPVVAKEWHPDKIVEGF